MEDPEINGIALEEVIVEAINGNKESLNSLLACGWMKRLVNKLSSWALKKFKTECYANAAGIQGVISEKLLSNIHTVKNPRNKLWRVCLESWCRRVVRNYCLNVIRKSKPEIEPRTKEPTSENPIEEQCSMVMTPEEKLLTKEEERLWEDRGSELRRRLQRVISTFSPADASITHLWAEGKKLRQIATATRIPLSTVQRREAKILKALFQEIEAFMKEIKAEHSLEDEDEPALKNGLKELVAHCLQEMASGHHALRISM